MTMRYLAGILARDLRTLRRELERYPDERDLWRSLPGIANPAGNLALHLTGNLRHFIGAVLGGDGYVRDRPAEFARRDVPRAELLAEIDAATAVVERVLPALDPAVAAAAFPIPLGRVTVNTTDYLTHLTTHFAYHLGQVDYHRRVATGDGSTVGAQAVPELVSARPAS